MILAYNMETCDDAEGLWMSQGRKLHAPHATNYKRSLVPATRHPANEQTRCTAFEAGRFCSVFLTDQHEGKAQSS